jgi:CheY-like chemotaxis protein
MEDTGSIWSTTDGTQLRQLMATCRIAGLVTDIRLGGGPDGWKVARHAREAIPHLPVVYISAYSAHEHTARGVPDSIMVQKPFAAAQITTAISTHLNALPPQQQEE